MAVVCWSERPTYCRPNSPSSGNTHTPSASAGLVGQRSLGDPASQDVPNALRMSRRSCLQGRPMGFARLHRLQQDLLQTPSQLKIHSQNRSQLDASTSATEHSRTRMLTGFPIFRRITTEISDIKRELSWLDAHWWWSKVWHRQGRRNRH